MPDERLHRRLVLEFGADFLVSAFEILPEIFGDDRVLRGVVHDDEMRAFTAGKALELIEQPQVIGRAKIERIENAACECQSAFG